MNATACRTTLTCLLVALGCSGGRSELVDEIGPSSGAASASGGQTIVETSAGTVTGNSGAGGAAVSIAPTAGQGGAPGPAQGGTGAIVDAATDTSTDSGDAGAAFELNGAPLIFAPRRDGFGVNVVLLQGNPGRLSLRVREPDAPVWQPGLQPTVTGADIAQWSVVGLLPGRQYQYQVLIQDASSSQLLYSGSATTQRAPGDAFTFAVVTDNHTEAPETTVLGDYGPQTLAAVARDISNCQPDFFLNLGDMLDSHYYGFNLPPPDGTFAKHGYMNYRRLLGDTLGNAAHYPTIGNWDGEDGCFTVRANCALARPTPAVPSRPGTHHLPRGWK